MQRQFDREFKQQAVNLVIKQQLTVKQVAQDLGIGRSTLMKWLALHRKGLLQKDATFNEQHKEILRLRKENRSLKMERDILKKAAAIFSQENSKGFDL